jgi:hypothetical protein
MRKVLNKILSALTGPRREDGVTVSERLVRGLKTFSIVTPSSRGGPVSAFLVLFFLLIQSASAQVTRPTTFDDRGVCENSKGVWRQFGNGCADFCHDKFDRFAMCTQALVFSCECGKNRCWNGESCVALKSYKKIFDAEQAEEQKVLNAAKEKRKADALANEEEIMTKLVPPPPTDPNAPNPNPSAAPTAAATPEKFLTPNPLENQAAAAMLQDPEPTSPITQIPAPVPLTQEKNQEPVKVGIPDFFLKKQAQAAGKAQDSKAKDSKDSLPAVLPDLPLPN